MIVSIQAKPCLACNKPVKGRTDKKFCDDYCRNAYNNQLKADSNNLIRNINNALRKNRRILEELLLNGETSKKVNRDKLLSLGFHFKYITHIYTTQNGKVYHFCYEHGYLSLENDWYLVVKRNEE
jgi:predicted nucleic acid-binding Zn ribbon protein